MRRHVFLLRVFAAALQAAVGVNGVRFAPCLLMRLSRPSVVAAAAAELHGCELCEFVIARRSSVCTYAVRTLRKYRIFWRIMTALGGSRQCMVMASSRHHLSLLLTRSFRQCVGPTRRRARSSSAVVACLLIIASKPVTSTCRAHDGRIQNPPPFEDDSIVSRRLPPSISTKNSPNELLASCHAGAICAGPGRMYPIGRQPGTIIQSRFVVPDLPKQYDSTENTYYDYLNIFWRQQPTGGYMNQFVPQLMLGNALANSTNGPEYHPSWIKMDTWHIGAQYFMGLCVRNDTFPDGFECDKETWVAKAVTDRLVPVEPGELIETRFELDAQQVWRLHIGVVGGGPDRQSHVTSKKPFMGLVESTKSWGEEIYDNVYVGSCLENYGMESRDNYPAEWQIGVKIWSPKAGSWWRDWRLEAPNGCPWQPTSQVDNIAGERWQKAVWRTYLE